MRLCSHQPNLLPYMGFFYKASMSDAIVLSDDVQFSKKGMHNWNFRKSERGRERFTMPVRGVHQDTRIRDVELDSPERWAGRLEKTFLQGYSKAAHFDEGAAVVSLLVEASGRFRLLSDLNSFLIFELFGIFGIGVEVIRSSDIGIEPFGDKDGRILRMCRAIGADSYVSGIGASSYHDPSRFEEAGVSLEYADMPDLEYPQTHGAFEPNLSVIDWVFNMGFSLPEGW